MKKLSVEEAEQLCKIYLSKLKDKEQGDFLMLHSKVVGDTAVFLAEGKMKDKKVDVELLKIAGWVHDIGYYVDGEEHTQSTLELLQHDYEVSSVLKDCILNHGSNDIPETEEGKIMQIADKISFLHPFAVQLLLQHNPGKVREDWIEFYRTQAGKAVDVLKLIE